MTTTSELRNWWAPACQGPFTRVVLFGEGIVSVRTRIVEAVDALDKCLRKHNYRTRKADTGAYNCRKITGGTGYSLHAYGIALDINWESNPYGSRLVTDMPVAMIADIKAIRTKNGKQVWRWGGDYTGNKDAMHFEIVCHPNDLSTGLANVPVGQTTQATQEDDDMACLYETKDAAGVTKVFLVQGNRRREQTKASADHLIAAGVPYKIADSEAWAQLASVTSL